MNLICGKKKLSLEKPLIMGIINLNPQSFATQGRIDHIDDLLQYAETQIKNGAAILDLGAEPTNPFVDPVISEKLENELLFPAIEKISKNLDCVISVDTSKPVIMREAIKLGADLINDVRALIEPDAIKIIAKNKVACSLMHMTYPYGQNHSLKNPIENNLVESISNFLQTRINACIKAGIQKESIIVDPGIGAGNFGKTAKQNLHILRNIVAFKKLGFPILIGVSRKAFIGEITGAAIADRLPGTLAATTIALLNGVNIIRTHDIVETKQAIEIYNAY